MNLVFSKKCLLATSQVEVINNGSTVIINMRLELEAAIIENIAKHYILAHIFPIMADSYYDKFCSFGETTFCQELLEWTANTGIFPPEIMSMLQIFKYLSDITSNSLISLQH